MGFGNKVRSGKLFDRAEGQECANSVLNDQDTFSFGRIPKFRSRRCCI